MLETVLLIPFVVVMIVFIYQAYITVNRVQVVQKYLKAQVIGLLMNRYEVTAEQGIQKFKTPTDGQYYYVYNEFTGDFSGMNAGLDKATTSILLTFMSSQGDRAGLEARLTKGKPSTQMLGICVGGRGVMKEQVDTGVFDIKDGDTCDKK